MAKSQMMVRHAEDDFGALRIGNAVEQLDQAEVVSITYSLRHALPFLVFIRYDPETLGTDDIDRAIEAARR